MLGKEKEEKTKTPLTFGMMQKENTAEKDGV